MRQGGNQRVRKPAPRVLRRAFDCKPGSYSPACSVVSADSPHSVFASYTEGNGSQSDGHQRQARRFRHDIGGVTNASKVVICEPYTERGQLEKLVLVMITSPPFEEVSNCPALFISRPVRPVKPVEISARTLPLLSSL